MYGGGYGPGRYYRGSPYYEGPIVTYDNRPTRRHHAGGPASATSTTSAIPIAESVRSEKPSSHDDCPRASRGLFHAMPSRAASLSAWARAIDASLSSRPCRM